MAMLPREPTCHAELHEDSGRPNHGSLWKMFASKTVVSLLLVESSTCLIPGKHSVHLEKEASKRVAGHSASAFVDR